MKLSFVFRWNFILIFLVLTLLIICCSCENTTGPEDFKDNVLTGNISFRSIIHSRSFIRKSTQTQLIVMRSVEDKNNFLDSTYTMSNNIGFNSFKDSMLVGIIYGEKTSVSATFSIDSVIANPSLKEIIVYSHLFIPVSKLPINGFHSHFIALPKSYYKITINEIEIINEPPPSGKIIPFTTLFSLNQALRNEKSTPDLIILRTKQDELSFLDSTTTYSNFDFPVFSYADSMLVGVLYPLEGVPNPALIISLLSEDDTVRVNVQHWANLLTGGYSNPGNPCHFVGLQNDFTHQKFILNDLGYLVSEIKD